MTEPMPEPLVMPEGAPDPGEMFTRVPFAPPTSHDLLAEILALRADVAALSATVTEILGKFSSVLDDVKPGLEKLMGNPMFRMFTGGK